MPFVAGLPAPLPLPATPTSLETSSDDEKGIRDHYDAPAARDRVCSGAVPGGDASGESGANTRSAGAASRCEAFSRNPSVKGSTPAEENRAVPVPVPRFWRAEDSGGSEGTEGSKNRTGFHSYDETHQVMGDRVVCGSDSLPGVRAHRFRPTF